MKYCRLSIILLLCCLAFKGILIGHASEPTYRVFNPNTPIDPYGLIDLDADLRSPDYAYCRWGTLMDQYTVTDIDATLRFTQLTKNPFRDLFITNSDTNLLVQQIPASSIILNSDGRGGSVIALSVWTTYLFRQHRFSDRPFKDALGNTATLDSKTKKAVILIHGWNPESLDNSYAPSPDRPEFGSLVNALHLALKNQPDWKLLLYHWEADADTGPASFPYAGINGSEAAEIAHLHGQHLGELLDRATQQNIEKIHFIAHSAGSWAARAAIKYLLSARANSPDAPGIKIQLTLLDPFIPGELIRSDLSRVSYLTRDEMSSIDGLLGASDTSLYKLENYYAKDTSLGDDSNDWWLPIALSLGTQAEFEWRIIDTNMQVDWGDWLGHFHYDTHWGPLQFYADTVNAARFSPEVGLKPFLGLLDTRGWKGSIFYQEPVIRSLSQPDAIALNGVVTLVGDVVLRGSGQPDKEIACRWEQSTDGTEWRAVTTAGDIWADGSELVLPKVTADMNNRFYRLLAKTRAGVDVSKTVKLSVIGAGTGGDVATAPAAATNLQATVISATQINLIWRDNSSNETGFKIERATTVSGPWTQLNLVPLNTQAFQSTGLAVNTLYYYRVGAYNSANSTNPAWSAIASARTAAASNPSATYTLAVHSVNPPSGARIFLSTDANGNDDADTPIASRTYAGGKQVTVVASATAGGNRFMKWQRDGVDLTSDTAAYMTMDCDHMLIAVYAAGSSATRTLTGLFINGSSTIAENSSRQYTATATFSDGSSSVVTPQTWVVVPSTAATISSAGLLDAGAVNADTSMSVAAAYFTGGVTKTASKTVTITNSSVAVTYALAINSTLGGHVRVSPDLRTFPAGTEVTVTAYPDDGYLHTRWSGNTSGSDRTISLRMDGNKSVTAHFAEDTSSASVRVAISPPQAVQEAAGWKVIGKINSTNWQPSGDTFGNLKPGAARVTFKDIPGWVTPSDIPVTLIGEPTPLMVSGTYREIKGSLQVTIAPQEAAAAGARWRIDGGLWRESGAVVSDVTPGSRSVEFSAVPGWSSPATQTTSVPRGQVATVTGTYSPPAGFPIITSVTPRTGPIEGGTVVTLEGANFQAGANVTFGSVSATSVTVVSPTQITAVVPPRASYGTVALALTSGGQTVTQSNGFTYTIPLGQNMTLLGQIGGEVNAVALKGSYAVYGEGSSLIIADVSNPSTPILRGRIALPGKVTGIAITGDYAVASVLKWGIQIIDISDVNAPKIVGFFDLPGESQDVAVMDNLAYVAAYQAGLQIVDLTDKSSPIKVGEFTALSEAVDVEITSVGNKRMACVASWSSGTHVLDVTNSNAISQLAHIPFGSTSCVAVSRSNLFAPTQTANGRELYRYDLTNPANPAVNSGGISYGSDIILASGNYLYMGRGGLFIKSLVNPSQPVGIGSVALPGSTKRMAISGDVVYLANGTGGLVIASVANKAAPSKIAAIGGDIAPRDVFTSDGFAYLAQGSLAVVDVKAPQRPVRVGTFSFSKTLARLTKAGNYLFSASNIFGGAPTLLVANPQNPIEVSVHSASPSRGSYDVATLGSNYLVAGQKKASDGGQVGLWLYNGANPTSSTPISTIEGTATESFVCVASAGTRAFVANGSGRVMIVDYTTPTSPTILGSVEVGASIQDLAATSDGAFLYAAASDGGVRAIDCRVPTKPEVVGKYCRDGYTTALSVALSGTLVVYADFGSIVVVDFSNPAQPVKVAEYDTPGYCERIATLGDLVFAPEGSAGMEILRIDDVSAPLVEITSPTKDPAFLTSSALIAISGTATDLQGVMRITWKNDRGGGGVAQGTTAWTIPNVQLVSGLNRLTVTAEDGNGNVGVDVIEITATFPDTSAPVVTITGPKADSEFITNSAVVTLSGAVADDRGVATIKWLNERGGSGSASINGNSWTIADMALLTGPNKITVMATDAAGNNGTASVGVFYIPPDTQAPAVTISFPTLEPIMNTDARKLNLSGSASDDRHLAEVRWVNSRGGAGKAAGTSEWNINEVPLEPGVNVLSVTAVDEGGNETTDTLSVNYVPLPQMNFVALAGKYGGLLDAGEDAAMQSGFASVSVTRTGKFTASPRLNGVVYRLIGAFLPDGTYSGSIKRGKSLSPLMVSLRLIEGEPATISGTISDGVNVAVITTDHAVFSARKNPAPQTGRYTVIFARNEGDDKGAPRGHGYGTLTVSTAGLLRLAGILADGSTVTQGTTISKNGVWPLYVPLYGSKGALGGPMVFRSLDSTDLDGSLVWQKPSTPKARLFPAGFDTTLAAEGSLFRITRAPALALDAGGRVLHLGDGDLSGGITKNVSLGTGNVFSILNPAADRLTLRINPSTGLLSGSFIHPKTNKPTSLRGAVLQKSDRGDAFFLNGSVSGFLELEPAP